MVINDLKYKIDKVVSKQPSRWMEKALWEEANEAWLDRSADIALRILTALHVWRISQKELAEKIGVSPQQVSKIVKGKENLTLETIARLEVALGVALLVVPPSGEIAGDKPSKTSRVPKKASLKKPAAKTV